MNNYENTWGRVNLEELSESEAVAEIGELLSNGADVNTTDHRGHTVLMHAVCLNNKTAVDLLVKHGADVNVKSKKGGTALMFASFYGEVNMVEKLIGYGADINAQSETNQTALMHAAENEHIDTVRILIERGANVNICDKNGHTALKYTSNKNIKGLIRKADKIREEYLNKNVKNAPKKTAKNVSKHNMKVIDLGKKLLEKQAT